MLAVSADTERNKRAAGYITVIAAAILFGCESVTVQLAYQGGWNIITLLSSRFFVSALLFLFAVRLFRAPLLVEPAYRLQVLALSGLTLGGTLSLYLALANLPAALAILFFYAYPSLTALVSRVCYRQPLTADKLLALLISAAGLVLLYWSSAAQVRPLGILFALCGALAQSFKLNMVERLLPRVNQYTYNFNVTALTALYYALGALLGLGGGFSLSPVNTQGWLTWIFLALFVTTAASFLLNRGASVIGAVNSAIIMLLEPPTTAFTAYLFFRDLLSPPQLLGGALILAAVALPMVLSRRAAGKAPVARSPEP